MLTTQVISTRSRMNVRTVAVPAVGSAVAIATVALTHSAVDIAGGSVSALMPTIRERFQLSAAGIGVLVAAVALCTSMAQPIAGRIADRFGAKRVAATGAVLCSALLSTVGIAGHVWIVVALIVVGGFSSAGYHPASVVMARRVLPDRAQLAVSLFSAGGMLGLAVGPLAVLLIAAHAGIGFTPLLMVPGVVLGGVMWHFLPADPPPVARDRAATRSRSMLRGPVGALTLASALMALAATTFSAGLPLWLTEHAGFDTDAAAIGVTLALFQIGAVAGGLLSGYLSCRILPSRLCFASLMLAAPALGLALCTEPGGPGFYAVVTVAGALTNAVVPLLIVAAQEHSRGSVGLASGMVMGLANGAGGLGFVAIGFLADSQGLRAALLVGFAAVVPAALIARRALAERPTSDSPQLFVVGCGCACSGCSCEPADGGCGCEPGSCICDADSATGGRQATVSGPSAPAPNVGHMRTAQSSPTERPGGHMNTETSNRQGLITAWDNERAAAAHAIRRHDPSQAWNHLERAHIISQPMAGRHVRTHLAMLRFAVRTLRPREVAGQLFRTLVAAPGSWSGRYPLGNTGGADVSAFAPMEIPDDLRPLLASNQQIDPVAEVAS